MEDATEPVSSDAEREERVRAAREMSKAHDAIGAVRVFFWTMAVVSVLVVLCGAGWLRAVGVGAAALFVAGALDVRRRPVLWSVVLAA